MEGLNTSTGGSDLRGDGAPPATPPPTAGSTTAGSSTPPPTNAVPQSPAMPQASLAAAELGLPPSLAACQFHLAGGDSDNNNIDSDGEEGPYMGHVEVDEAAVMYKEEVVAAQEPPQVSTVETPDILNMRVSDLKDALKARNLSTRGRKAELQQRLRDAVTSGAPLVSNMTQDELENMAGEGFRPCAH